MASINLHKCIVSTTVYGQIWPIWASSSPANSVFEWMQALRARWHYSTVTL